MALAGSRYGAPRLCSARAVVPIRECRRERAGSRSRLPRAPRANVGARARGRARHTLPRPLRGPQAEQPGTSRTRESPNEFYAIGQVDGMELHLKEAPKSDVERQHRRSVARSLERGEEDWDCGQPDLGAGISRGAEADKRAIVDQ